MTSHLWIRAVVRRGRPERTATLWYLPFYLSFFFTQGISRTNGDPYISTLIIGEGSGSRSPAFDYFPGRAWVGGAPPASAKPTKAQREPCRLMEVKHLAFSMTDATHARLSVCFCASFLWVCTLPHAVAFLDVYVSKHQRATRTHSLAHIFQDTQ